MSARRSESHASRRVDGHVAGCGTSEVAELFCRNRFGDAAVRVGFERGFVVDFATGRNVSDEEQMKDVEQGVRDEEPVLLIGSPMCRACSTLSELTQAGKPSEVSRKNLVEQCATHLKFCFRIYETQRHAGRSFLHEHPWDSWSRDLSVVKHMAEMDDAHKTKGDLCRFQLATNSIEKGTWFVSNSECIIEELSMRCYNRDGQAKNHMKNFLIAVLKGLKGEIDSVKAIGSMEDGVTFQEPNEPELDENAEELQNVFENISGVRQERLRSIS